MQPYLIGRIAYLACLVCGLASLAETAAAAGSGDPGVRPGRLFVERPTPQALAFRWPIDGDNNGNAKVSLRYRSQGAEAWRSGLDLSRVGLESRAPKRRPRGSVLLAGSLVGLAPGRHYEVELALTDPDGGGETRSLTLRTASEPRLPSGLRRRYIEPDPGGTGGGGQGSQSEPFRGLSAAAAAAQPGDLLLLAPGTYRAVAIAPARSGKPGAPIVFEAANEGPVTLDGGGNDVLLELSDRRQIWVRGLSLKNADTLIRADRAREIVVQGNRFEVDRAGYVSSGAVADESYGQFILDNHFIGPTEWPRSKGIEHIFGVALSGSGHVIAYNRMESLGDCIRGAWADGGDGLLSASDIHHNDLQSCTDDGIEIDHADANVRVFANRITNSFAAISFQPVFGGPVYVYRNRIYNTLYSPFKLHNDTSGVLMMHNTSVRSGIPFFIRTSTESVRDSLTRNNLFVGTEGPALNSTATMIGNDFDSDGYAWSLGDFAHWNGKAYGTIAAARRDGKIYRHHGATRLQARELFAGGLLPIPDESNEYDGSANRPALEIGSPAVDRAVRVPGFNDAFVGEAPEIGRAHV